MSWLWIVLGAAGLIGGIIVLFVIYSLLGLFSKRVRDFQLKVTRTDKHPGVLTNQSAIEFNMGRFQEVLDLTDRALQVDPNCMETWFNRGIALDKLGRLIEAEKAYGRAVEIEPRCKEAWYNRGVVLTTLGREEEAENAYRKAIEIDDNFWMAWQNLATLLHTQGREPEAEKCLRRATYLRQQGSPLPAFARNI